MPLTSASASIRTGRAAHIGRTETTPPAGTCPAGLTRAVRTEVRRGLDWRQTAERVADALRGRLPDPAVIVPEPLRRGDPACYQSHLLYAEPDGSFSITAMVWLPGQETVIHDHVAWCVTAVLQGREHEEFRTIQQSLAAIREALADVTHQEGRS